MLFNVYLFMVLVNPLAANYIFVDSTFNHCEQLFGSRVQLGTQLWGFRKLCSFLKLN